MCRNAWLASRSCAGSRSKSCKYSLIEAGVVDVSHFWNSFWKPSIRSTNHRRSAQLQFVFRRTKSRKTSVT